MRNRILIFLSSSRWMILLATSLCLFTYALFEQAWPLAQEQWDAWHALRALEARLQQAQTHKRETALLQKQNAHRQTQIERLISHRNREAQLSHVLHFLSHAAQTHDLQILKLAPHTRKSLDGHVELPLELELRAHFHAFSRYLNTLETAPMIIAITGYKITALDMTATALRVQLRLSIYYLEPRS